MAYIYEGHMGDLFTTDHELSFDERYCEQCGDSDSFLGEANTADEAWSLFESRTAMYDYSKCEEDDCEECEFYEQCCGYNYGYVARFISEEFADTIENPIRIVLLMTHPKYPDRVFVKYKKCKHGTYPELPFVYTLDENITFHIKEKLFLANEYVEGSLKQLGSEVIGGIKYIYFAAQATDDIEKAHYYDDSWVGFASIDELSDLDKHHFTTALKNVF